MDVYRKLLKELRDEFNFDQKDMAEKLNLSPSAYGYYEQGRNEPSLETLVKIAKIFDVSTDYLLGLSHTRKIPIYYSMSDKLALSSSEVQTIEQMKELLLLEEISENPKDYVTRLNRYWNFLKEEQNKEKE